MAPELLHIEPHGWAMPKTITLLLYAVVTSLFVLFILGVFKGPGGADKSFIIIAAIFGSAIYTGAIMSIKLISKSKREPLIFTERGIVGPYFTAIKWEDIEGYTWETFQGFTKMANAPKGGGTSLFIKDKGILPQYVDRFGHTVFANFGYFFDPNQISKAEGILQRFEIRKMREKEIFS